jgi:hypothetical protein
MAETENVSEVLSFATIIMHSYYTVLFLSLFYFSRTFCQFCNGKMRRKINSFQNVDIIYFKLATMKVIFKH